MSEIFASNASKDALNDAEAASTSARVVGNSPDKKITKEVNSPSPALPIQAAPRSGSFHPHGSNGPSAPTPMQRLLHPMQSSLHHRRKMVAWVPDSLAEKCYNCQAYFTLVLRRHHCRRCGNVFCDACSSARMPLVSAGFFTPVRVCDKCCLAAKKAHQKMVDEQQQQQKNTTAAIMSTSPPLPLGPSSPDRNQGSVPDLGFDQLAASYQEHYFQQDRYHSEGGEGTDGERVGDTLDVHEMSYTFASGVITNSGHDNGVRIGGGGGSNTYISTSTNSSSFSTLHPPAYYMQTLPGEIVLVRSENVRFRLMEQQDHVGTLYITNYRLAFFPPHGSPYETLQHNTEKVYQVIHIMSIERAKRKETVETDSGMIDLVTKDFRHAQLFFEGLVSKQTFNEFDRAFHIIRQHAFGEPAGPIEEFAKFSLENFPLVPIDGWQMYDPIVEYKRMGLLSFGCKWRLSHVNQHYELCPTYPSVLAFPNTVTDQTLVIASKFRSKGRIPTLTWRDPHSGASICRSSQPLVGLGQKQCDKDVFLIQAIAACNPSSSRLVIIDARPWKNAVAQKTVGRAGYELTSHYETKSPHGLLKYADLVMAEQSVAAQDGESSMYESTYDTTGGAPTPFENQQSTFFETLVLTECKLVFMGIENIHVMRKSFLKLLDLCITPSRSGINSNNSNNSNSTPSANGTPPLGGALGGTCGGGAGMMVSTIGAGSGGGVITPSIGGNDKWMDQLASCRWLDHVSRILEASVEIAKLIVYDKTSILVHCSDGWDRTSQVVTLAQLLLDPYYRTIEGFMVLIEKDWCSFGHKFRERIGHGKMNSSESSPVFVQWIDCVWQIMQQFPSAFEFHERFLLLIVDHLYSCRFGTFLYDSEKERKEQESRHATVSLWTFMQTIEKHVILNVFYQPPALKRQTQNKASAHMTTTTRTTQSCYELPTVHSSTSSSYPVLSSLSGTLQVPLDGSSGTTPLTSNPTTSTTTTSTPTHHMAMSMMMMTMEEAEGAEQKFEQEEQDGIVLVHTDSLTQLNLSRHNSHDWSSSFPPSSAPVPSTRLVAEANACKHQIVRDLDRGFAFPHPVERDVIEEEESEQEEIDLEEEEGCSILETLLLPNPSVRMLKFWSSYYLRWDPAFVWEKDPNVEIEQYHRDAISHLDHMQRHMKKLQARNHTLRGKLASGTPNVSVRVSHPLLPPQRSEGESLENRIKALKAQKQQQLEQIEMAFEDELARILDER